MAAAPSGGSGSWQGKVACVHPNTIASPASPPVRSDNWRTQKRIDWRPVWHALTKTSFGTKPSTTGTPHGRRS
jgi:hypothetical protein